jgi:hypothetical protein
VLERLEADVPNRAMDRQWSEARLHDAASRMARQLVQVIEGVLYQWEVGDAEDEFFEVILAGLTELEGGDGSERHTN